MYLTSGRMHKRFNCSYLWVVGGQSNFWSRLCVTFIFRAKFKTKQKKREGQIKKSYFLNSLSLTHWPLSNGPWFAREPSGQGKYHPIKDFRFVKIQCLKTPDIRKTQQQRLWLWSGDEGRSHGGKWSWQWTWAALTNRSTCRGPAKERSQNRGVCGMYYDH